MNNNNNQEPPVNKHLIELVEGLKMAIEEGDVGLFRDIVCELAEIERNSSHPLG